MKDLKEISKLLAERSKRWDDYDFELFFYRDIIDKAILTASSLYKDVATLTLECRYGDFFINNENTACTNFDELIAKITKYLIFNGFAEEDITLDDTGMHIKL